MLRFLEGLAYTLWAIPLFILFILPDVIMFSPWQATYPWTQTLLGCLLVLLAVYIAYHLAKKWGYVRFDREFFSWKTLGVLGLAYLSATVINHLCSLWLEALGKSDTLNNQIIMERIGNQPPIFVWLALTLLPAVVEEVICRGILMTKLFGRNSWLAVVVSSLVFAALHGPTDLPSWVIYGFMGGTMGYLYKRTGNLAYPMALHFFNNGLATLLFYL